MDAADRATEAQEQLEELQRKRRVVIAPDITGTGRCLNCEEPVPPKVRWCNKDCQFDWSKRENRRER